MTLCTTISDADSGHHLVHAGGAWTPLHHLVHASGACVQVRLSQLDKEGAELREENTTLHARLEGVDEARSKATAAEVRVCSRQQLPNFGVNAGRST